MAEKMNQKSEDVDDGIQVSSRLSLLFLLGFAVVIIGIILVLVASLLGGPDAAWLITISIAISAVMILAFVFMRRKNYRQSSD
jgi:O-antigen/teichoic acid export membrane protein